MNFSLGRLIPGFAGGPPRQRADPAPPEVLVPSDRGQELPHGPPQGPPPGDGLWAWPGGTD